MACGVEDIPVRAGCNGKRGILRFNRYPLSVRFLEKEEKSASVNSADSLLRCPLPFRLGLPCASNSMRRRLSVLTLRRPT